MGSAFERADKSTTTSIYTLPDGADVMKNYNKDCSNLYDMVLRTFDERYQPQEKADKKFNKAWENLKSFNLNYKEFEDACRLLCTMVDIGWKHKRRAEVLYFTFHDEIHQPNKIQILVTDVKLHYPTEVEGQYKGAGVITSTQPYHDQ